MGYLSKGRILQRDSNKAGYSKETPTRQERDRIEAG
jgi:hypothetical protein